MMDDMELRKKEHIIDYKKMNANGKDKTIDFDITKKSRCPIIISYHNY